MIFSSDASIKVLEYAQRREAKSRDFYRECLDKATIPGTKQILRGLVEDEERHYTIVTGMLTEARANSHISLAAHNQLQQLGQFGWIMLAIAINPHHKWVTALHCYFQTSLYCASYTEVDW